MKRPSFFENDMDFPWEITHMNIPLLKKYSFYTIIEGYSDVMCQKDDFEFLESLFNASRRHKFKINKKHFYTLLWLVSYFKKGLFEEAPFQEWKQEANDEDLRDLLKLKKDLLEIWNNTNDLERRRDLTSVTMIIRGRNVTTKSRVLLQDKIFNFLTEAIEFNGNAPVKGTKKKIERTKQIEFLRPLALLIWKEKILPSKSQTFDFIILLLEFYGVDTKGVDFKSTVRDNLNLPKKIG